MPVAKADIAVFWFRRDLRLEDNHGLLQALNSSLPVLPVFIFDKSILKKLEDKKDKRVSFIYETLENLQKHLQVAGSSLHVFYDYPLEAFKKIEREFQVKAVFTNRDYEPFAKKRDEEIGDFLATKNIAFHTFKDQVLFEKDNVLKGDGTPYTVFTPYSKIWKQQLAQSGLPAFHSEKHLVNLLKTETKKWPTFSEMGFEKVDPKVPPMDVAKQQLEKYAQTRNLPAIKGTSHASTHLRFGLVSPRKLIGKALNYSETWLNELIWREFFMMILYHFPEVEKNNFKRKYDGILWRNNEEEFTKWCQGKTGYPMVDAGMRELNETGLMHNRVRMVVASFLTKHLLLDWRWGEAYFAAKLLDYDLSANNGNWQWAAGTGCDAAPYFRIFNPTEQAKKFDANAAYIKKWVPELHELSYPLPMVDHKMARMRALATYKAGLNAKS